MTEAEKKVVELAVQWRRAARSVEEALLWQDLLHAIDMVRKERRDAKAEDDKES